MKEKVQMPLSVPVISKMSSSQPDNSSLVFILRASFFSHFFT